MELFIYLFLMLSLVFHLCELNIFNSGCYVIVTFEIVKMFLIRYKQRYLPHCYSDRIEIDM